MSRELYALIRRGVIALEKLADAQADHAYIKLSERGYDSERPPRLWSGDKVGEERR